LVGERLGAATNSTISIGKLEKISRDVTPGDLGFLTGAFTRISTQAD